MELIWGSQAESIWIDLLFLTSDKKKKKKKKMSSLQFRSILTVSPIPGYKCLLEFQGTN